MAYEQPPPFLTARELIGFLHHALDTSIQPNSSSDVSEWLQWRQERTAALGRSEHMALAELEAIGHPTSAHDEQLLGRLGWSRPYAQRMLARLEEAGLVRVIPDRSGGQGRPRKLYEPTPLQRCRRQYQFTQVDVPELPVATPMEPRPLAQILQRRLDRFKIEADVTAIVDARAISVLEALYVHRENDLRWLLNLAAAGAEVAVDAGAERVEGTHIFRAQRPTD